MAAGMRHAEMTARRALLLVETIARVERALWLHEGTIWQDYIAAFLTVEGMTRRDRINNEGFAENLAILFSAA